MLRLTPTVSAGGSALGSQQVKGEDGRLDCMVRRSHGEMLVGACKARCGFAVEVGNGRVAVLHPQLTISPLTYVSLGQPVFICSRSSTPLEAVPGASFRIA